MRSGSLRGVAAAVVTLLAAALLAGAAAPAGAAPLARPQPRHGSPGSPSTSTNWAGYDATGAVFTSVTATWTQPAVAPSAGRAVYAAFWVGLDGDTSPSVEQIGTEGFSQGGTVSYDAWYEMYPKAPITIGLAVRPGDSLTGTVTTTGSGSFTLSLVNHTTGRSFTTQQTLVGAQLASAEVIAEAPSRGGGVLPLATFGIVDFSACAFNAEPISLFAWQNITLVSGGSTPLAVTSALSAAGTGFFATDDFTAPMTTVHGATQAWHDDPVALTFTATDGAHGSGVATTEYSLDGGVSWSTAGAVTTAAPADHSNDGLHTVLYRSVDVAGNVEQTRSVAVGIDTRRPTPLATKAARVRRGHTATLLFSVRDPRPGAPTAAVTIRVRTSSGRLVKKAVLNARPVNTALRYSFVCRLPAGTYRFSVYATDAAGNPQTGATSNRLIVL